MTDDVIVDTPKTDFYLKFADEAEMKTAMSHFYQQDYTTVVDEETGEETQTPEGDPYLVSTTKDYAISVVGTIHEPTGNTLTDSEGNESPEMAPVAGHHVNFRLRGGIDNKDADDADAPDTLRDIIEGIDVTYGQTPATPHRVWL